MRYIFTLILCVSLLPVFAQQGKPPINPEDVRKRYINAVGGESVIRSIKDIKLTYSGTVQSVFLKYTEWKSQGRLRRELLAMSKPYQTTVYNPDGKSRIETQGQPQELSATELTKLKRDADIQAILHPEEYGMKRKYLREERTDSVMYDVLQATDAEGNESQEYYDQATGFLVREAMLQPSPQGPMNVIIAYSDYREVAGSGGYKIPYKLQQGSAVQELEFTLEEVAVNRGMADSLFE